MRKKDRGINVNKGDFIIWFKIPQINMHELDLITHLRREV